MTTPKKEYAKLTNQIIPHPPTKLSKPEYTQLSELEGVVRGATAMSTRTLPASTTTLSTDQNASSSTK